MFLQRAAGALGARDGRATPGPGPRSAPVRRRRVRPHRVPPHQAGLPRGARAADARGHAPPVLRLPRGKGAALRRVAPAADKASQALRRLRRGQRRDDGQRAE